MHRLLLIYLYGMLGVGGDHVEMQDMGVRGDSVERQQRQTEVRGGRMARQGRQNSIADFPAGFIEGLPEETNVEWQSLWLKTGTVPECLPTTPDHRLFVRFSNGVQIRPNDTVTTGLMLSPPDVVWRTEPGGLYTILLVNADIDASLQPGGRRRPSRKFVHWMVANIPNVNLDAGNIVLPYIPSLSVRHRGGSAIQDPLFSQRHLFLVYKQSSSSAKGTKPDCYKDTVKDRLINLSELVAENGLEGPVAGNFIRNVYTPFVTDTFLCSLSRCSGTPFPASLSGVNTQDYCQSE